MGKYQRWCFPQKVYAMREAFKFAKFPEICYNISITRKRFTKEKGELLWKRKKY